MRKRNPHVFCRGTVDPISLGVLALIVTSIVIGTVAVIRTASFDIRQRAQTYPTRYSCQSGSCVSDPNGEFLSIGECDPLCNAPVASPRLPNGSNCSSNSQCSSNFCNNGICQNPATCSVSCQNGCYSSTNTCIPYCDQTKCSQGCIYDTSAGGECRTGISQCVHQSESCDPSTNIAELECCYGLYCQVSSGGAKCISDIATTQCDTSKCPLGCITGTTTCKVFCDENKCPYGCSSQTSSGGSCNPAPPPPPVTSNGSCYYGTISCTSLNRYSASGCLSSCPTSMIAACCGDVIPEAAKICTPNVTRCANSTALEMCTNNGTGWITQTCASGLKCENNKCVTPTQVGDSCSQPHGKSVSGNIYCCNGTAQSSECSGSVAHYPGQVGELPEHTWCEWGVFASCARCKDGKTYSQNNKDYCGKAPPQEPGLIAQAVPATYPVEALIYAGSGYYEQNYITALETGNIPDKCEQDLVCNYIVTNTLANLTYDPYILGDANRNRFGAAVGLGAPAGVLLGGVILAPEAVAAGATISTNAYNILQQFNQTPFGQGLTNFGNQLFNSPQGVITQLGIERTFGIDLSPLDYGFSGFQTTGALNSNSIYDQNLISPYRVSSDELIQIPNQYQPNVTSYTGEIPYIGTSINELPPGTFIDEAITLTPGESFALYADPGLRYDPLASIVMPAYAAKRNQNLYYSLAQAIQDINLGKSENLVVGTHGLPGVMTVNSRDITGYEFGRELLAAGIRPGCPIYLGVCYGGVGSEKFPSVAEQISYMLEGRNPIVAAVSEVKFYAEGKLRAVYPGTNIEYPDAWITIK